MYWNPRHIYWTYILEAKTHRRDISRSWIVTPMCQLGSYTVVQDYWNLVLVIGVFRPIKIYRIMLFSVASTQFAIESHCLSCILFMDYFAQHVWIWILLQNGCSLFTLCGEAKPNPCKHLLLSLQLGCTVFHVYCLWSIRLLLDNILRFEFCSSAI